MKIKVEISTLEFETVIFKDIVGWDLIDFS